MSKLTIEQLKVNATAPLGPMQKKALVDIINDEFRGQQTIYDAKATEQKEQILEQYKKGVGFTALKKKYDDIQDKIDALEKKKQEAEKSLESKGLDTDGQKLSNSGYGRQDPAKERAIEKINALFKTVEAMGPNQLRGKIIARMWLAETNGEACVILQQVLGNGIIPSISSSMLLEDKTVAK